MLRIDNPRDVIHRKALVADLDAIVAEGYATPKRRDALARLKAEYSEGQATLRQRFEAAEIDGLELIRANAYQMDQLVRTIFDFAVRHVYPKANPTKGEQLAVAAVGGYGRGELAPQSDVDLLFLLPYKQTPHGEQIVEYMLYMLWDLGLKVGHATRSIDDCIRLAKTDLTIRTAMLDARDLWGDKGLFNKFMERFQSEIIDGTGTDFVESKLSERDARHERMGDTRFVVEPNVKDGKGGLRDLQTLMWLVKYLYDIEDFEALHKHQILTKADVKMFGKAFRYLWTVRCHLHYLVNRPEERLTFDVQTALGQRMGYRAHAGASGVERFMKHYLLTTKEVGDLTRIICAVLEEKQRKKRQMFKLPRMNLFKKVPEGFKLNGARLSIERDSLFREDPVNMLRLFHHAQELETDIHPRALRKVTLNLKRITPEVRNDPEANRIFLEMVTSLKDPENTLRRMNESGLFGKFVPDFGRVVAQMQYDMYHVYTVDEHTIRAIGILWRIETGQLSEEHRTSSAVIDEIHSRRALYMAVLLHDIAKGRGGDHSELGAEVARKLCPRFGLSDEETESVAWLIEQHLLLSRTAFKRDVNDPHAIDELTAVVQSPERLRMLLVLTAADIRAVGPGVWNHWKAGLLSALYYNTLEAMSGGIPAKQRAERVFMAQQQVRHRLEDWPEEEVESFIALGYANYWLGVDLDTKVHHAALIRKAKAENLKLHIETRIEALRGATEIIVYTNDHPGLFSQIAGAIALAGASVMAAKIFTLTDGMALDTFHITNADGSTLDGERELKRVYERIYVVLEGRVHLKRELEDQRARAMPTRTSVFTVTPRVLMDNKASTDHTVIEVNGRDRTGLLYDVTATLTAQNLQIGRAHISTYGERAVDVFYVKDLFGLKIWDESRMERIRQELMTAITLPVDTDDKA
ncbi:[protein-PII] uridylyltransferase [Magnetospira sp. QH-2]|uniref:[protein-PII] uridylyltransferase n=1 Tax=Magnetospira sp. (strain QH-2) TaxID=1288970 RepID=UPI0005F9F426|nr:[protein-PII] uridylyltransferase [Magnetospira sp. QH-2]